MTDIVLNAKIPGRITRQARAVIFTFQCSRKILHPAYGRKRASISRDVCFVAREIPIKSQDVYGFKDLSESSLTAQERAIVVKRMAAVSVFAREHQY